MGPKWKLQSVEPVTCDPIVRRFVLHDPIEGWKMVNKVYSGCRYVELYDILVPEYEREYYISAVFRICPAHSVSSKCCSGKLRWSDGSWKPLDLYLEYQKKWFFWLNYHQWKARVAAGMVSPEEPMPLDIVKYEEEPLTTGNVTSPSEEEQTDMSIVYAWNKDHSNRYSAVMGIFKSRGVKLVDESKEQVPLISWKFQGHGDDRILYIDCKKQLSRTQLSEVQDICNIQLGPNKVVVEI